jgi:hypothetical protein
MKRRTIVTLLSALLIAGCTANSDSSQNVFAVQRGITQGGPASTVDVVNIGLPMLHNMSADVVRLRWVRLAEHYRGMRVLNVTAYKYSQVGAGIAASLGDLRKHCRKDMTPYPVAGDATPPHKDSNWLIVIAITFSKPGRYAIKRAKIGYRTNGHDGWQYQNLDTTVKVHKAKPGTKPTLTGCMA